MGFFDWLRSKKELVIAVPLAATLAFSHLPANAQVSKYNQGSAGAQKISFNDNYNDVNASFIKSQGIKPTAFLAMDSFAKQKRWNKYYYIEDKSGNLVLNDRREILIFSTLASVESYKASVTYPGKIHERKIN